jgi:hypothetical protein
VPQKLQAAALDGHRFPTQSQLMTALDVAISSDQDVAPFPRMIHAA